jgi:hypothetical protein
VSRYVTPEVIHPAERFAVYRLCDGDERNLQLIATCASPEAVGVVIITLGREGEWDDCPVGVLDRMAEDDQPKWVLKPWKAAPREVSHAARVLANSKKEKT